MFTKEAIKLAKATVDAIKKIAERQEKKCPRCKGQGELFQLPSPRGLASRTISCPKCNGTGKLKWEWEPEEGDHIVLDDEVYLLFLTRDGLGYDAGISCGRSTDYSEEKYYDDFTQATKDNCIPLLHWERIEEILGKLGYDVPLFFHFGPEDTYEEIRVGMYKRVNVFICEGTGNSRQEAVMRAVIELGKERSKP